MIDEALVVHVARLAGIVPAVLRAPPRGLVGLVPVTFHDVGAADRELARRAARHLLAVGVDDLDLAAERHLAARLQLAGERPVERRVARIEQGHDRRRLGHAVGMHQPTCGITSRAWRSTPSGIGEAP